MSSWRLSTFFIYYVPFQRYWENRKIDIAAVYTKLQIVAKPLGHLCSFFLSGPSWWSNKNGKVKMEIGKVQFAFKNWLFLWIWQNFDIFNFDVKWEFFGLKSWFFLMSSWRPSKFFICYVPFQRYWENWKTVMAAVYTKLQIVANYAQFFLSGPSWWFCTKWQGQNRNQQGSICLQNLTVFVNLAKFLHFQFWSKVGIF